MNVLGIETSCDETSIGIISDDQLKANLIASQDFHANYGGVVPELSSRAHLQIISPLLKQALEKANLELKDIDLISATAGPGLIGALLVGLTFAKGLTYSLDKKFVAVNHIEGHIFSGFLMHEKPEFPYLCLVVSGGHTLLLIVEDDLKIRKLGTTVDDAAGEAFDKVGKMIGLGYPGGPKIQKFAENGNEDAIQFPISRLPNPFDFSFSGLKTAVLRYLQNEYGPNLEIPESDLPNITASFQKTVSDTLLKKIKLACTEYEVRSISLVGGVAANRYIKNNLIELGRKLQKKVVIPDLEFCGDNAAMIAYRGLTLFNNDIAHELSENAFPSLKGSEFVL
jgi:N6-L-threonylcarbamoyladenine synthase